MNIHWDTGRWRNCFHMNPPGYPHRDTAQMSDIAIRERRFDVQWGVVNPGNAVCAAVFRTRREAREYKRQHAYAYVVVRVVVTPLYEQRPDLRREEVQR